MGSCRGAVSNSNFVLFGYENVFFFVTEGSKTLKKALIKK